MVDPDLVGLGYIARWRSAKRLSGCAFKARCLYRTMSVKWWNWRRILTISKLARKFMERGGSRFGIGFMARLWPRPSRRLQGWLTEPATTVLPLSMSVVPTRLGDGSVDVEVDGRLISPFTGERIKVLSIRGNWLRNAEPGSMAHVVSIEATGRTTLDVDGARFHYDVEGLHRA